MRDVDPPYKAAEAEWTRLGSMIKPKHEDDPEGWENVRWAIGDMLAKRNVDHN
jgi:hypothetical protein